MVTKLHKMTGDYEDWLVRSLRNKKEAAAYLQVALDKYQNDDNLDALLLALRDVAQAQGGMGILAKKTQLNRESLYKTLSHRGNPKLVTLIKLLRCLGFQLLVKPVA